jgi:predicted phage-related endonuclease
MSRQNINEIMKDLANYQRLAEETAQIIDGLKDQLKNYMTDEGLDTLNGDEHKATYKEVTSSRVDTSALNKELPEIAERYTKTTSTMRFTFA